MFLLCIYIFLSLLISRSIIKANIFNIASLSLIAYWVTYPLERLKFNDYYITINGIKEVGVYMYAIFGFSFLLGAFIITKLNIKKINLYPSINSKNNLFFISFTLAFLGLICFSYTYNFNINEYFQMTLGLTRGERMASLSEAKNALPYSIFFVPSITTLLITIKKFGLRKSLNDITLTLIIVFLNSPIFFSYFIEGDRTAIIKLFTVIFFTLGLSQYPFEKINNKSYLIENFRINKTILLNRIKVSFILFLLLAFFTFIGFGRANGWRRVPFVLKNIQYNVRNKLLPTGEFRGVNYTIDFALARNHLDIKKTEQMFTWDKLIFYPLPTYVYKAVFNVKKPLNVGDMIGLETKNYIFGADDKRKLGFALSPIAEGLINVGSFGVFIIGFIYGMAISLIQSFYNKISLDKINLLDICIINSIGMVPLIMRAGTSGIYNWIFSTTFVILLPIVIIEIFQGRKFLPFFTQQDNDVKK